MQTLARKMAEVFCGTPLPPPNREVKLLIVMHGFRKKKKPLVVDERNGGVYSLV